MEAGKARAIRALPNCRSGFCRGVFEELADERGAFFEKAAVVGAEVGEGVAVDVYFADDLAVRPDGNDDFRSRFQGAGEVARVAGDIVDDHRFFLCDGGSADAFGDRDAGVFGRRADKWTQDQHLRISRIKHVEAYPVVAGEPVGDALDGEVLEEGQTVGGAGEVSDFRDQSFVDGGLCFGHGRVFSRSSLDPMFDASRRSWASDKQGYLRLKAGAGVQKKNLSKMLWMGLH